MHELTEPKLTFKIADELETIKIQNDHNGTFTVSAKFWELSSDNTKNIFKKLPSSYLKNMKNPCFWEKHHYTKEADPYALSPYAPPIGATMKYDPWGHVMYYKRARERFSYHTNYWLKK